MGGASWPQGLGKIGLLAITLGCGGGGGDGGGGPAASLTIVKGPAPNGDGQSGPVAQPLADSFRVLVADGSVPQAGITVTWVTSVPGAVLSPAASVTDGSGRAASRMTLGRQVGTHPAQASIPGRSVTFTASAGPGAPSQLILMSGNDQAALKNTALAAPLRVRVSDQFGNSVGGAPVAWSIASGAASVSSSTTQAAADGVASVSVTIGSATGPVQVRAVSGADTVMFTALGVDLIKDVLVKNNFYESATNGSQAPAVDTIPAGQGIRWLWQSAAVEHNIISQGTQRFPGSQIASTPFTYGPIGILAAGTYHYECSLHAGMSGIIVVE